MSAERNAFYLLRLQIMTEQGGHRGEVMGIFSRSIKEFRLNSIFVRIFIYIMALVLISIGLVSFFSYRKSSAMMISEVQNSNMLILKQAQKGIDQKINSLQANLMQAALNRSLNEVLYLSNQSNYDKYELIQDSMSYLSALKSNNNYISDIWLYAKKTDFVLGTESKYERSLFFSDVCKYTDDIDWDQVFGSSGFNYIGKKNIYRGTYQVPVVVFSESLPFIDKSPKGMLIVNVSDSLFEKELSNYNKEKIIFHYIVDKEGNIVYTNEQYYDEFNDLDLIRSAVHSQLTGMTQKQDTVELMAGGKPFTIQYIQSQNLQWKYISVIPTEYIKESVNQIRNVTLLVVSISIILSIVLTIYIVNGLYRPMNKILSYINIIGDRKTIENKKKNRNEFALINGIIDYVYKENQTLQDNYEKSRPMLQDKFIYDIINGQVDSDSEKLGLEIGIELPFPFYQVIVYVIDGEIPGSLKKYKISHEEDVVKMREIAELTLGEQCKCYFLAKDEQTIVSVLNAPESFYELSGMNEYLAKVQEYMNKGDLPYVVGVGNSYKGIRNCYRSFIDALETIKYQIVKGQNSVIYIDEVKNTNGAVISYPLEKETQLIMITKSGNSENVVKMLEDIFYENFSEDVLSPEMIDNLFHALAGTAVRTIFEMRLTNEQIFTDKQDIYKELDQRKSISEKKQYVIWIFKTIALFAADNKRGQQNYVLEKIDRYLEENYNKEISLDTVAAVVNLSASYLSFVFKENSGLNFVDYVNQFRLRKAKELLENTSYNISQIAELVGYSSANSFSKVFKKYNGISPAQYRKI